jgi:hypothetical protein
MANPSAPATPSNVKPATPAASQSETPETGSDAVEPGGTIGSKDKFTLNELNQFPVQPTVEDALGIERIVGPALDNWEPAPVDPDEDEIARLERVAERSAEAKERRANAFTSRHPAAAGVAKAASDAEQGKQDEEPAK